jgi:hypothetical protein
MEMDSVHPSNSGLLQYVACVLDTRDIRATFAGRKSKTNSQRLRKLDGPRRARAAGVRFSRSRPEVLHAADPDASHRADRLSDIAVHVFRVRISLRTSRSISLRIPARLRYGTWSVQPAFHSLDRRCDASSVLDHRSAVPQLEEKHQKRLYSTTRGPIVGANNWGSCLRLRAVLVCMDQQCINTLASPNGVGLSHRIWAPVCLPSMFYLSGGRLLATVSVNLPPWKRQLTFCRAASTVAANIMLRSSIAAGFPLFSVQMFSKLGVEWAATLLGIIAVAMIPIPILFRMYGGRLRVKSRMLASLETI